MNGHLQSNRGLPLALPTGDHAAGTASEIASLSSFWYRYEQGSAAQVPNQRFFFVGVNALKGLDANLALSRNDQK